MKKPSTAIVLVFSLASSLALAAKTEKVTVKVSLIDKTGTLKPAGTVTLSDGKGGLTIMPKLKGLPPGEHGFHIHEKGSCDPAEKEGAQVAGLAAGGHFDPDGTKAHKGPGGGGHKGDLPKLEVSDKGVANAKLEVPGVTLADVRGKALMIHANGDNYADAPKPLGGGGDRIACGVIPEAK